MTKAIGNAYLPSFRIMFSPFFGGWEWPLQGIRGRPPTYAFSGIGTAPVYKNPRIEGFSLCYFWGTDVASPISAPPLGQQMKAG
jgi:hypothetical protein